MKNALMALSILMALSGCGSPAKDEAPAQAPSASAPAVEKKALDLSQAGVVQGVVRFNGTPPETRDLSVRGNPECAVMHPGGMIAQEEFLMKDGLLQNVFVYVKSGLEAYDFPAPSEPVIVDNNQCRYAPHVVGAQVGQPIHLVNSDPTLHNVRANAQTNKPWNLGLPLQGMKQVKSFSQPEVAVKLKCDVHPWMSGYIGVLAHPYFQVTGADGSFSLKNLPPGTYELAAWHEKLGEQTQTVTLAPGQTQTIDWTFSN